MKSIPLLPADEYRVVTRSVLTEMDRKNVVSLYEPIIGHSAVSLYLTLWRDLERTKEVLSYTHHHLMTLLKSDLESIKRSRESLEAFGLLKTYYKEGSLNVYLYELYAPLQAKEFFAHPILNVVLYNNIGKYEYDLLKEEYKTMRIDLREYTDISKNLDETYVSTNTNLLELDAIGSAHLPLTMQDQVDFDLIISSLPKGILNEKAMNKKMRELINNLAFIYHLDTLKITELLRTVINEKGYFDKDELRLAARKYYQYQNNGKLPTLIYRTQPEYLKSPIGDSSNKGKIIGVFENTSPYDFLKNKYKGSNPTSRDLKLLEMLLIDIGLTPSVVNVLIDYVLKKNNNRLDAHFVETIAGHWKRAGIETAKDAMDIAEKEHKKYNRKAKEQNPKAEIEKPVWFNQTISKEELSREEQSELENILEKYR